MSCSATAANGIRRSIVGLSMLAITYVGGLMGFIVQLRLLAVPWAGATAASVCSRS